MKYLLTIQRLVVFQLIGKNHHTIRKVKLEQLLKMSSVIQDPDKMTPDIANKIMDTLGINTNINRQEGNKPKSSTRIGRNEKCPLCTSGLKYKKCCGK